MQRLWVICVAGVFSILAVAPSKVSAGEPPHRWKVHRDFALHHPGSAAAGQRLFADDQRLACHAGHRITGKEKSGPNLFADLSDLIHISGNQGLMCVAFHPNYERNRRYFLEYEVEERGKVKTVLAERRAAKDGLSDSGQPSVRLLEVEQPAFNHNGGCIMFGPDGMLYAGFGDGGPQKDPPGYAQNPHVLLGSMIRIDVDHSSGDRPYAVPDDNPFLAAHREDPSVRPETWAIGFSVTGGHVYRADSDSSFDGVYIFCDYNTRRVWGLRQQNGKLLDVRELGTAPGGIASFGGDHQGELLLVTYGGTIYQLALSQTAYR